MIIVINDYDADDKTMMTIIINNSDNTDKW